MSLVLAVVCPSGIVMAADRRSSCVEVGAFSVVSDDVQKVGAIGSRFIFGVTGRAQLDLMPVASKIRGFAVWVPPVRRRRTTQAALGAGLDDPAVRVRAGAMLAQAEAARLVSDDLRCASSSGGGGPGGVPGGLEILLAGFDADGVGRLYVCEVMPDGTAASKPVLAASTRSPGIRWSGETDVPRRLFLPPAYWSHAIITGTRKRGGLPGARRIPYNQMTLDGAGALAVEVVRRAIAVNSIMCPPEHPTIGGGVDLVAVSREGIAQLRRVGEDEMRDSAACLDGGA